MISMDKKHRTRDGREVRVYAVDGGGRYPIHGAIKTFNGWINTCWETNGQCVAGPTGDLIEVKPRIQREYWVNVYPMYCSFWEEKEHADSDTSNRRLACVKITIDCEEGEGL